MHYRSLLALLQPLFILQCDGWIVGDMLRSSDALRLGWRTFRARNVPRATTSLVPARLVAGTGARSLITTAASGPGGDASQSGARAFGQQQQQQQQQQHESQQHRDRAAEWAATVAALSAPVGSLPGVGAATTAALASGLGVQTVGQLLFHLPRGASDRARASPASDLRQALSALTVAAPHLEPSKVSLAGATLVLTAVAHRLPSSVRAPLRVVCEDPTGAVVEVVYFQTHGKKKPPRMQTRLKHSIL